MVFVEFGWFDLFSGSQIVWVGFDLADWAPMCSKQRDNTVHHLEMNAINSKANRQIHFPTLTKKKTTKDLHRYSDTSRPILTTTFNLEIQNTE